MMWRLLPVILPWSVFLVAGFAGIDFGRHWDERDHIENVQETLRTGTLLPTGTTAYNNHPGLAGGYYGYPSFIYWISLFSAAPEILRHLGNTNRPELIDFIGSSAFTLRVRGVCLCISSLALVWVYLLVLRWRRSWRAALLAASMLATSWEINYHSRWIATDAIVMQFAALCLLFCVLALEHKDGRRLVKWAAVAAGLAAGTKYPAVILITMVWATARSIRAGSLHQLARLTAIAAVTFLLTTPGAILQPWHFYHWLQFNRIHYGSEGHFGYTIPHAWPYLRAVVEYEALVLFSHFPVIAVFLAAPAVVGAVALFRQSRRLAMVVLIFPLLYVAFFTTQVVLIVRNLLALSPFLAVLSAVGLCEISSWLRKPVLRRAFGLIVVIALAINACWSLYAAWTIRQTRSDPSWPARQLVAYMRDHPDTRFDLDPFVGGLLNQPLPQPPAAPRHEVVVVCSWETQDIYHWPANIYNLAEWPGPYEVNFNYYPTWLSNRIVMLDFETARGLPVEQVQRVVRQRLQTPGG